MQKDHATIAVFEDQYMGVQVVKFASDTPITRERVVAYFEQAKPRIGFRWLVLVGSVGRVELD